MEYLPGLGIGLFVASVVFFLLWLGLAARRRLDIEQSRTPLYSSTGGGRIGRIGYRGPFISLRIYDEFVVIKYGGQLGYDLKK